MERGTLYLVRQRRERDARVRCMYEIISSILKYVFITVIYIFIFDIIRMIYLDIRSMSGKSLPKSAGIPYLKLVSLKYSFDFKLEESYLLTGGYHHGTLA